MPILCIHNPVIHKDPQAYYQVEVGFTKLHTCPQQAVNQVCSVVEGDYGDKALNLVKGWVHYRPSRVGPVLRLPAAKGNRKVTVLVWLESPCPATETVTQGQQIFNQSELTRILHLVVLSNPPVPRDKDLDVAIYTKAAKLLKEQRNGN